MVETYKNNQHLIKKTLEITLIKEKLDVCVNIWVHSVKCQIHTRAQYTNMCIAISSVSKKFY